MSIPIHSLLNPPEDLTADTPREEISQNSTSKKADTASLQSPASNPSSPPRSQPSPRKKVKHATEHQGPTLSPQKSTIYNRRANGSPQRLPILSDLHPTNHRAPIEAPSPPSLETDDNRFSIFNGLLNYPELLLEMSKHLLVKELLSLYCISRDFHQVMNRNFTAFIRAQSTHKAKESSQIFIHRCYKNLCLQDPAGRTLTFTQFLPPKKRTRVKDDNTWDDRQDEIRYVPGFRWLRMVLYREAVVRDIFRSLAREGHLLPKGATRALKKLWFMMDISDNARRIGLMHNEEFWTKKDLFLITMFFLKLDMRLTNPTFGNGETRMRKLLLGQRSLSVLARVLRRTHLTNSMDLIRMMVRFDHSPQQRLRPDETVFGLPPWEVGSLAREGWDKSRELFVPLDDLVMGEGIRRRLKLQNHYVSMMLWGYINKRTFEDIMTPRPRRKRLTMEEALTIVNRKLDLKTEDGADAGSGIDDEEEEEEEEEDGHEEPTPAFDGEINWDGLGMPTSRSTTKAIL